MPGRHEPGSNRSFYLSVATSTLRLLITAALVVAGATLINQAFPRRDEAPVPTPTTPVETSSPTPSASPSPTPTQDPDLLGLKVFVYNGTTADGLAADTLTKLKNRYSVVQAANGVDTAPQTVGQTAIYYRGAGLEAAAAFLAQDFFKDIQASVAPLDEGAAVPGTPDIVIYIGTDYVGTL
ncbi:MAG: LytR C-terminal domain-containing protein [Actinomycetota bacterium]